MKPTDALQSKLYKEILSHIEEADADVPDSYKGNVREMLLVRAFCTYTFSFLLGNIYYSRYQKGKEYEIYCRKKDEPNAKEEVIQKTKKEADEEE